LYHHPDKPPIFFGGAAEYGGAVRLKKNFERRNPGSKFTIHLAIINPVEYTAGE
jgi:hypothetical protein